MAQKLIQEINKTKLTASWKTNEYSKSFGKWVNGKWFGYIHYGIDCVSSIGDQIVYAAGDGVVVASGWDNVVGNVIAILYLDAVNSKTGKVCDVVKRYYHFDKRSVEKWDKVTKDTKIGLYGSTGLVGTGKHLHIEVDTDIAYPIYSPTVKSSSLLRGTVYGANDKTMSNPVEWIHCKNSSPDKQEYTTTNDKYISTTDKTVAIIK